MSYFPMQNRENSLATHGQHETVTRSFAATNLVLVLSDGTSAEETRSCYATSLQTCLLIQFNHQEILDLMLVSRDVSVVAVDCLHECHK